VAERLYKIAGSSDCDDLNSCPTVIGFTEADVILQGRKLDAETRERLNIPEGEDAIVMPKALYLQGAQRVAEGA
jgi:hypothetical protein